MAEEHERCALHLLFGCRYFMLLRDQHARYDMATYGPTTYVLDLVSVEVGNAVDYDPRERPAKVHCLMHDEGHDARSQHIVLHPLVPGQPEPLEEVQRHVVLGDLLKLAPVRVDAREQGRRVPSGWSAMSATRRIRYTYMANAIAARQWRFSRSWSCVWIGGEVMGKSWRRRRRHGFR